MSISISDGIHLWFGKVLVDLGIFLSIIGVLIVIFTGIWIYCAVADQLTRKR